MWCLNPCISVIEGSWKELIHQLCSVFFSYTLQICWYIMLTCDRCNPFIQCGSVSSSSTLSLQHIAPVSLSLSHLSTHLLHCSRCRFTVLCWSPSTSPLTGTTTAVSSPPLHGLIFSVQAVTARKHWIEQTTRSRIARLVLSDCAASFGLSQTDWAFIFSTSNPPNHEKWLTSNIIAHLAPEICYFLIFPITFIFTD